MAKKDFRTSISNQIENKDNLILKDNNKQLSNKLEEQNKKIEELQKALSSEKINKVSYDIPLEDIKLGSNCRDTDFLAIEELAKDISKVGQLQPVVISKDNFLICGFRRYYAIKSLKKENILAYTYEKTYEELQPELLRIQFTENEQRKNLDNFEIAKIYKELEDKGLNQVQISEIFDKDKAIISKFLKLNIIDDKIKQFIKEIQFFGYSQKKLNAFNFLPNPLGIVGINTLYKIASKENLEEQSKAFLATFRSKLTEEEINSFGIEEEKEINHYKEVSKITKKLFDYVSKNLPNNDKRLKIEQKIKELEKLISN
ncbi:MAG: ParB/RepB/Spo0J family partition protein [Candidatus Sericytochromatia bacterium]